MKVNRPHSECVLLSVMRHNIKRHFLIAVYLLRWGGNSCVNTAVAMETAGFLYLLFFLSFLLTHFVHVVQALKPSESLQAPLPFAYYFGSGWLMCVWTIATIIVSHALSWQRDAPQEDVCGVPAGWLYENRMWVFFSCLNGRRAWIETVVDVKVLS